MRLVSENEAPLPTDDYRKGFREGLHRVAYISVPRSREELKGLLTVMRYALQALETIDKQASVLKLVEE